MSFGVNDYPWATGPTSGNDKYGYALRQCASFANWRCVNDLHISPDLGGNGGTWGDDAAAKGFPVDGSPRPHDIMAMKPGVDGVGQYGHVAVVLSIVDAGHVLVEDYNWLDDFNYRQHVLPIAGCQFAHIAPENDPMTPAEKNDLMRGLMRKNYLDTLERQPSESDLEAWTAIGVNKGVDAMVAAWYSEPEVQAHLAKRKSAGE